MYTPATDKGLLATIGDGIDLGPIEPRGSGVTAAEEIVWAVESFWSWCWCYAKSREMSLYTPATGMGLLATIGDGVDLGPIGPRGSVVTAAEVIVWAAERRWCCCGATNCAWQYCDCGGW